LGKKKKKNFELFATFISFFFLFFSLGEKIANRGHGVLKMKYSLTNSLFLKKKNRIKGWVGGLDLMSRSPYEWEGYLILLWSLPPLRSRHKNACPCIPHDLLMVKFMVMSTLEHPHQCLVCDPAKVFLASKFYIFTFLQPHL